MVPVWISDGSGTEFGPGKLGHRPSSVACIYSDDRAPDGRVLLRTMVGGARNPEPALLADGPLLDTVQTNLREIMGITAEPEFASIYRHERAIPQYLVGHAYRLAEIDRQRARFPGLFLTGNAYRGVSLNDCVLNALHTAQSVVPDQAGDRARQP